MKDHGKHCASLVKKNVSGRQLKSELLQPLHQTLGQFSNGFLQVLGATSAVRVTLLLRPADDAVFHRRCGDRGRNTLNNCSVEH